MYASTALVSLLATSALGVVLPRQANNAPINISSTATANVAGTGNNIPLVAQLENIPTYAQRINLLPNNADFVYDFLNPPANATTSSRGGRTVKSDRGNFPALTGTGVSMTLGFLGPCGFNTPHIHPRSSEINVVVQGALTAQMTLENGAHTVINNLTQYQMSVFPQGAMHTEFNPDCTNSTFVAGFASEDPGVQQIAQTFFNLNDQLVAATLGGSGTVDGADIDAFRPLLPANVVQGVNACLQRCNIAKRSL